MIYPNLNLIGCGVGVKAGDGQGFIECQEFGEKLYHSLSMIEQPNLLTEWRTHYLEMRVWIFPSAPAQRLEFHRSDLKNPRLVIFGRGADTFRRADTWPLWKTCVKQILTMVRVSLHI